MGITFTGNLETAIQLLFFVLLFFFSVYALFLGYHWFTFGAERRTATIAMAVYLGGGAVLFMTLATAMHLLTP